MIRRIATAIIAVVLVFAPAASAQVPGANPVFFPSTQSIGSCTSSTGGNYLYFIPGHIIHEFTSSGTYTPSSSCTATYLMIGGGGAGGGGTGNTSSGGGGCGGILSGSLNVSASPYAITAGAGGAGGGGTGGNGGNSSFGGNTATGGGGGAGATSGTAGSAGGCGGGSAALASGGAGTAGQGNNGGGSAFSNAGGGGGGAGTIGGAGTGGVSGNGGAGISSSISGASALYGGGGGGGGNSNFSWAAGTGGSGGGGNGATNGDGAAGTANAGGGGGGGGSGGVGGNGGSGAVFISEVYGGAINVSDVFTSASSQYLSATGKVTANAQKFTFSISFKRASISTNQLMAFWSDSGATNYIGIELTNTNAISITAVNSSVTVANLGTTATITDTTTWHYLVVAVDTTQAVAANRIKIYLDNTTPLSSFSTSTYPAQNTNLAMNKGATNYIGVSFGGSGNLFNGKMANYYYIDGQQLTPTSFYSGGTPIVFSGGYSGTADFFLPFTNGAALGNDQSGEGNNWTSAAMTPANQSTDYP